MAFTYFFRDLQTLEFIVENVLPATLGRSNIWIWDAGCASGQEPYSLAILFSEKMGHFAFKNLKILATDIDGSDLFENIIKNGVYPYEDLSRIPEDIFNKYFEVIEKKKSYKIIDKIRNCLEFKKHDLLTLQKIRDDFSLVICKNVLLHFQYEERIKVIKMFYDSLLPGGFFAMEQTQKMPDECSHLFEKVVSNAQLYRKI